MLGPAEPPTVVVAAIVIAVPKATPLGMESVKPAPFESPCVGTRNVKWGVVEPTVTFAAVALYKCR